MRNSRNIKTAHRTLLAEHSKLVAKRDELNIDIKTIEASLLSLGWNPDNEESKEEEAGE